MNFKVVRNPSGEYQTISVDEPFTPVILEPGFKSRLGHIYNFPNSLSDARPYPAWRIVRCVDPVGPGEKTEHPHDHGYPIQPTYLASTLPALVGSGASRGYIDRARRARFGVQSDPWLDEVQRAWTEMAKEGGE